MNGSMRGAWNKFGGDRQAALADAENARNFATNNAAWELTCDMLSRESGMPIEDIRKNQNLYGAANKMDDIVNKRGVAFLRQSTNSLGGMLAVTNGGSISGKVGDFVMQRFRETHTSPDAMVNAGIDRLSNPELTPTLRPGLARTVGRGLQRLGGAASPFAKYATLPGALSRLEPER